MVNKLSWEFTLTVDESYCQCVKEGQRLTDKTFRSSPECFHWSICVFYLQKTAQFHFQRHFLTRKTLFNFLTPVIILRACLHGGGGPQVGEVSRLGGVTYLSI